MRKQVLWIWTAISLLLILSGCTKPAGNEVGLGKEFTLATGQSAAIAGEKLSIKFVEVISDSRCPQGATCIWAGEASCLIEITNSESTYRKVLTQPGLSEPSQTDFQKYEIKFDLQPYPQVGRETKKDDYRLQLAFSLKTALSGGILATFDVVGEKYSIFITNKETIQQVLALKRGASQATIPSGPRVREEASLVEASLRGAYSHYLEASK